MLPAQIATNELTPWHVQKHSYSHTCWDKTHTRTHQWSPEVEKTHLDVNKKISAAERKTQLTAAPLSDGQMDTRVHKHAKETGGLWIILRNTRKSSASWRIQAHTIKLLIKPRLGSEFYSNVVQTSKSITWCLSLFCLLCTTCIMYEHNFH